MIEKAALYCGPMNTTNIITKEWVLDFTSLERDENFLGFSVEKGVLHVTLKESVVEFRVDFMVHIEREIEDFRNATVRFDLPMPECITSDGSKDFTALCDAAAGPDEIVWWRERLEVQDMQYRAEMHHRNLSSGGDL